MPIIHCPNCDGQNVKWAAFAVWNPEVQKWKIAQVFDAGFCDDCGHEVSLIEREAAALLIRPSSGCEGGKRLAKVCDFGRVQRLPFNQKTAALRSKETYL